MIWFRPSVGKTRPCTSVQHGTTETVSTYLNAFVFFLPMSAVYATVKYRPNTDAGRTQPNPGSDYRQPSFGLNSESTYASFGIAASTSSIESHLLSGITICQHSMVLRTSTDWSKGTSEEILEMETVNSTPRNFNEACKILILTYAMPTNQA